jgi:hypothetical protein
LEEENNMKKICVAIGMMLVLATLFSGCTEPDTDKDGHPDKDDDLPNNKNEFKDTDGDGVGDSSDGCPNDKNKQSPGYCGCGNPDRDSDGDNVVDCIDVFPSDRNEWKDSDGDGVGDNADDFPYDATEQSDSDNDGVGDNKDAFPNNPYEQYDRDEDGVGDNSDRFPYDSTQSVDRDNDGYGDNRYGNNADAFPDNPNEWIDSDSDGVGDNGDIYDYGNAGINVAITKYQGDGWGDEWANIDPYFKVWVTTYTSGVVDGKIVGYRESRIFVDVTVVNNPIYFNIDVGENIYIVQIEIQAWDDDFWTSDEQIDIENSSGKELYVYFRPLQTLSMSFNSDGRLDLRDEMDGIINGYISVVGV